MEQKIKQVILNAAPTLFQGEFNSNIIQLKAKFLEKMEGKI